MDQQKLAALLKATLDPNDLKNAQAQLKEVHQIIGYCPALLQLIMNSNLEMAVRQAGVIYLKNEIDHYWKEQNIDRGDPVPFHIHEQDKALLRDAIVDACVHVPDLLQRQLGRIIKWIITLDFPERWTGFVDKAAIYLQGTEQSFWAGALLTAYHYKDEKERQPMFEAMTLLLPLIYDCGIQLLHNESNDARLKLRFVLKIFSRLIENTLPLSLLNDKMIAEWLEMFKQVILLSEGSQPLQMDSSERACQPIWRCKKWAVRTCRRLFERYGSPGNVLRPYEMFAQNFIRHLCPSILEVLFRLMNGFNEGMFVSSAVMFDTLAFITEAVRHARTWNLIKARIPTFLRTIVFTLFCTSDEDLELLSCDPHTYIHDHYDLFENCSTVGSAQTLLTACVKRQGILRDLSGWISQMLTNIEPRIRDGALHMVGCLISIDSRRRKQQYFERIEPILVTNIFPEFNSQHEFLRIRACCVMKQLKSMPLHENHLTQAVALLEHSLLNDASLPVRVEAAITLQALMASNEQAGKLVVPHIQQVLMALVHLMREVEVDALNSAVQNLISTYPEQISSICVEMTRHIAQSLITLLNLDADEENHGLSALGLMSVLETIVLTMGVSLDKLLCLEPIILEVIALILSQDDAYDLREEALQLMPHFMVENISPVMWDAFQILYTLAQQDTSCENFIDIATVLHRYVVSGTERFLSQPDYLLALFNMCKYVLSATGSDSETAIHIETQTHAAKLLEVVLLQCSGRVDHCIPPFVEVVISRLLRIVHTAELRVALLEVLIAALYTRPPILLDTFQRYPDPGPESVITLFVRQWLLDADNFLGTHARKLCVLGLCSLLSLTPAERPHVCAELFHRFMPTFIMLFKGLNRIYESKAQNSSESESQGESDEPIEGIVGIGLLDEATIVDILESDESEIDSSDDYLRMLENRVQVGAKDSPFPIQTSVEDDAESELSEDTSDILEILTTPLDEEDCSIDEFIYFKECFQKLELSDPAWYNQLISNLSEDDKKYLHRIFTSAEQRRAVAESNRIQKQGGYVFHEQTIPTSFKFGSD